MKIKQFNNIAPTMIIISLMALIFASGSLAGSLKERMKARQPQIIALKATRSIAENNLGYLEYRGTTAPGRDLVKAENQDRQAVYNAIARQQNTSAEIVGRRRAAQISARAPVGTWLQNGEGAWFRKQ